MLTSNDAKVNLQKNHQNDAKANPTASPNGVSLKGIFKSLKRVPVPEDTRKKFQKDPKNNSRVSNNQLKNSRNDFKLFKSPLEEVCQYYDLKVIPIKRTPNPNPICYYTHSNSNNQINFHSDNFEIAVKLPTLVTNSVTYLLDNRYEKTRKIFRLNGSSNNISTLEKMYEKDPQKDLKTINKYIEEHNQKIEDNLKKSRGNDDNNISNDDDNYASNFNDLAKESGSDFNNLLLNFRNFFLKCFSENKLFSSSFKDLSFSALDHSNNDIPITNYDIINLLKRYLNSLPSPVFPPDFIDIIVKELKDHKYFDLISYLNEDTEISTSIDLYNPIPENHKCSIARYLYFFSIKCLELPKANLDLLIYFLYFLSPYSNWRTYHSILELTTISTHSISKILHPCFFMNHLFNANPSSNNIKGKKNAKNNAININMIIDTSDNINLQVQRAIMNMIFDSSNYLINHLVDIDNAFGTKKISIPDPNSITNNNGCFPIFDNSSRRSINGCRNEKKLQTKADHHRKPNYQASDPEKIRVENIKEGNGKYVDGKRILYMNSENTGDLKLSDEKENCKSILVTTNSESYNSNDKLVEDKDAPLMENTLHKKEFIFSEDFSIKQKFYKKVTGSSEKQDSLGPPLPPKNSLPLKIL
ncbi:uncharacterized protein ASCRUDRAFT_94854 [Ascoidea rubescens DSM 1968]|uniref:Rho-GAP domain-containing protein n=1 Tax=Ascoidea rubescens DSM 1968 TaxID=1344418 RepID=A0A1D2VP32_9ASCO|nr:hypothetical protein ASCRUDRAFT_94854 [Ascoidea rubescens DSM 1968]ODV63370.1 hypothetical protein ASCRUDRAFT_94854 [Ascoidea rubescens DSM 1968]